MRQATSRKIATSFLAIAAAGAALVLAADTRDRRTQADPRLAERLSVSAQETSEPARTPAGSSLPDALDWLAADQNPSGSWGAAFEFADTATVVETLGDAQPAGEPFSNGAAWLAGQLAADNDELARKISALLKVPGADLDAMLEELLGARNPATADTLAPNYPEGGWGLQAGFETDSLTTALALMALEGAGRKAGIGVADAALAGGTTNVHEWEIAADAVTARIRISVSGSGVRLRMTEGAPPTIYDPYFSLSAGYTYMIVFPDSGLPFTAGTNYISVESPDPPAAAAAYSLTASYQTPEFDTRTFAEALDYLRLARNGDGGWGIQTGDATTLYTTVHVLLALQRYPDYDFDVELADGIGLLLAEQLGDGSFGVLGTPIPYLTALATLNLMRYEVCPFGAETENAVIALLGQQAGDGSWAGEPYDTGLALAALWEYDNDGDGVFQDGDCSGVVGDNVCAEGVTTGCDDNCLDYFNDGQGSVVFGQTVVAPDKETLAWPVPVDVGYVKGNLADVATYGVISGGAAAFADSVSTFDDNPAPGTGFYYLFRLAGDCLTASWQSSLGAEPGRDAAALGQVDVAITSPADGEVTTASPVTVSGTVDGAEPVTVTVNGVPAMVGFGTFSASVPLNRGGNTITASAIDAAGFTGSTQISVTKIDYSIPVSGDATGSRIFSGASALLDQIAYYTEDQIGVPSGIDYATTSVSRISATEMQIGFAIDVRNNATPGIYFFQVEYGLLDSGMNPLEPLEGNVFDFLIEIAP